MAIISEQRLVALAALAARLQKSNLQQARAPKAVTTAIHELNVVARLARDALDGKKEAEQTFRHELDRPARGFLGPLYASTTTAAAAKPSGATSALPTGILGGLGSRLGSAPSGVPGGGLGSGLDPQRPCGELLAGAHDVLQVAFQLDVRDGARQPVRTAAAAIYLRTRMGLVAQFERALWQAAGGSPGVRPSVEASGGLLGGIPDENFGGFGDPTGGFGGPSEPILPADDWGPPPVPPPDSGGPAGLGPGWCERLGDLCVTLFEQAIAGLLGDPYLDLLASVEPDCICHDYDPNQVFSADQRRAGPFRCRCRPTCG